jgi:hypothetical protein
MKDYLFFFLSLVFISCGHIEADTHYGEYETYNHETRLFHFHYLSPPWRLACHGEECERENKERKEAGKEPIHECEYKFQHDMPVLEIPIGAGIYTVEEGSLPAYSFCVFELPYSYRLEALVQEEINRFLKRSLRRRGEETRVRRIVDGFPRKFDHNVEEIEVQEFIGIEYDIVFYRILFLRHRSKQRLFRLVFIAIRDLDDPDIDIMIQGFEFNIEERGF